MVNVGLDCHCANSIEDQAFTGAERGGLKLALLGGSGDPKMVLYCVYKTVSKINFYELFSYLLFHMFCILHFTSTISFPRMFHKTELR